MLLCWHMIVYNDYFFVWVVYMMEWDTPPKKPSGSVC